MAVALTSKSAYVCLCPPVRLEAANGKGKWGDHCWRKHSTIPKQETGDKRAGDKSKSQSVQTHKNLESWRAGTDRIKYLSQYARRQSTMALTCDYSGPSGREEFVFWVKNQKSDKEECSEQKNFTYKQTNILKESSRQTLEDLMPQLWFLLLW